MRSCIQFSCDSLYQTLSTLLQARHFRHNAIVFSLGPFIFFSLIYDNLTWAPAREEFWQKYSCDSNFFHRISLLRREKWTRTISKKGLIVESIIFESPSCLISTFMKFGLSIKSIKKSSGINLMKSVKLSLIWFIKDHSVRYFSANHVSSFR